MQATGYRENARSGKAYHKRVRANDKLGSKSQAAAPSPERVGNDFLTTVFTEKPVEIVSRYLDGKYVNLLTEENYRYLYDSAMNYSRLIGKELKHKPRETLNGSIMGLLEDFGKIIGDVNINIESKGDRLVFTLFKYHECKSYTFFWLPVAFVEKLRGPMKRIAVTFLSELARSNAFVPLYNLDDYDYLIENLETNLDMGECDECDEKAYRNLIASYQEGRARKTLTLVHHKTYYKNLPRAIRNYTPANKFEEKLLKLFERGLEFIGPDKPRLMDYAYDPDFDPHEDFRPIDLERIVRYVYAYDEMCEQLEIWANCELQETYEISPVTKYDIHPDTTVPFFKDDYPERFTQWFRELSQAVTG